MKKIFAILILLLCASIGHAQTPVYPLVYIASPSPYQNNTTLTAGSNLTVSIEAGENTGLLTKVFLYNGATLLTTINVTPPTGTATVYKYTMLNLSAGTYNLMAKAEDAKGMFAQSGVIVITINPVPVLPDTTDIFYQTSANATWQETDCATSCIGKISRCPNDCENFKDDTDDYWNDINGQYHGSPITQLGVN